MQFKIIAAQDLDKNQRYQIAELCFSAFDEDPWSQYTFMQKAIHVVGILNNQIVSHALWTDRVFTINGSSDVKTAYVEYVTTDYTMRGKGLATQLLKYLVETLTHLEYGLAALQPENEAFYEKLGWTVWKGNLSIKQDTFSYLTDEYEIMLYSLNIQMKDRLSNSSEEDTICADWREGELW
ncbi:GNAT family N-acetyltransferase [Acinetobacter baumannii]|uniref:GNAT family N-acetyltransferase n=1 Tax=Acinetobacter baumannii TaxID=470 RepID=UPI0022BC0E73|nr:GNAT family N-acetyltransferase [Acinetobacter baumannii]MCZ2977984.1 GNAT family N-acetyltransferase [Acinetobacter baumannii]MDC4328247.1 GNAT family N-acetyltransferase [Acinetobacter baumannii]MDC4391405.1 GNAT family N-acetyltransferase [Acinetobacter baumannii]MDQ8912272.1 GNAT family N-acetyltransferase [Acinetobacter baumannii]